MEVFNFDEYTFAIWTFSTWRADCSSACVTRGSKAVGKPRPLIMAPITAHTGTRVKLCKRHCRLYIGPFSLIVSNSIHNEGLLNFCWSTGVQKLRQKTKSGEILQRDDKNGFPSSDEQCVSFSARQGNEI